MKTIEEFDAEIYYKAGEAQAQLERFKDNLGNLNQILGRDPTDLYELLSSSFEQTVETWQTTTRKNTEILQGYVDKLDRILNGLAEIMLAIDDLQISREMGTVDEDTRQNIDQSLKNAADAVKDLVADVAGVEPSTDLISMAVVGVGSYALLRFLGAGNLISLVGAGVVTYYVTGKKEIPEGKLEPVV